MNRLEIELKYIIKKVQEKSADAAKKAIAIETGNESNMLVVSQI